MSRLAKRRLVQSFNQGGHLKADEFRQMIITREGVQPVEVKAPSGEQAEREKQGSKG